MLKLRFGKLPCRLPTSSVGASPSALGAAMVFLSTLVAPAAWGQSTDSPAGPASDGGKVAEIIVTAQRRSENLQNTPVAVTSITGDALAAQHIDDISTISAVTPSVNFQSTNNAQASANLEIRGIGTVGNNRAFEGSVGVFVDGVYLSRVGQLLSDFLDFESLQILRDPQGTLFGKNTTAGALLITSVKPQFDRYDGSYEVTVGNYGAVLARMATNLPVSTTIALRFAALISNADGYIENPNGGDHYNGHRPRAFKAQVLFEPNSALTFRLIGDISIEHENCCYGSVVVTPGPVHPLVDALTAANGLKLASGNPNDYQAVLNLNTDQHIGDRGAVLLSDWKISPETSLHAITAYRVWSESQLGADFDFSGADLVIGSETFKSHQFSQEFDLYGRIEETPLFKSANYLAGLYFAHEALLATRDLFWGQQAQTYWNALFAPFPPGTVAAAPGRWSAERYPGDDKSYAAFTHFTFNVTNKLNALMGLRYTKEIKHGAFENPYFDPARNEVFRALGIQPGPQFNAAHSDSAVSGTAGLQYVFDANKMAYVTYSRGFKAGGITLDGNAAGLVANNPAIVPGGTPLNPTYRPEKIEGVEAGFKADYFDGKARSNLAVFYDKISDLQVTQFLGLQFAVLNAPNAKVYGAEIENTYRVTRDITLTAAATALPEAKIAESQVLGPPLSGRRFAQAPRWAGSLGANAGHSLNESIAVAARAALQYTGRVYSDTSSYYQIGSVTLLNAGLGIQSVNRSWSVEAWCLNCADRRYYIVTFPVPLQTGTQGAYIGAPRTFGLTLRDHF
jgi:iron complex outermembrane receptor protein